MQLEDLELFLNIFFTVLVQVPQTMPNTSLYTWLLNGYVSLPRGLSTQYEHIVYLLKETLTGKFKYNIRKLIIA